MSVSENLEDSTSGQLVEHIMASIAEFYSANLAEEVRKGLAEALAEGFLDPETKHAPTGLSELPCDLHIAPTISSYLGDPILRICAILK